MLLGTTNKKYLLPVDESFIIQLILQQRYAQVYELLMHQQSMQPSSLYNVALCLHWSGNYEEALIRLENIRLATQMANHNKLTVDSYLKPITIRQNQNHDYLYGMTEAYIKNFPELASDAVVRLKTDCWLQLSNYEKVIAVATPIAHKGYRNITDALLIANTPNDKRI
jgi:hypothetical protein